MMVKDRSPQILGTTNVEQLAKLLSSHELSWLAAVNPFSTRQTLPYIWCHRELIANKIKLFRIEQPPLLSQLSEQALADLANLVPGVPIRAFYARLEPNESIQPHIDKGQIFHMSHRCHLPILAPDGIKFICSGIPHVPLKGEWFEIDNCATHSVVNDASCVRIHLIVDILLPDFIGLIENAD